MRRVLAAGALMALLLIVLAGVARTARAADDKGVDEEPDKTAKVAKRLQNPATALIGVPFVSARRTPSRRG